MKELLCPNCNKGIGFWNMAKSPTPFHMKCDQCGTKLKVKKFAWLVTGIALVAGLSIGILAGMRRPMGEFIAVLILGVMIFEVVAYIVLRLTGVKLERRKQV